LLSTFPFRKSESVLVWSDRRMTRSERRRESATKGAGKRNFWLSVAVML
jgi:hypothetical protein